MTSTRTKQACMPLAAALALGLAAGSALAGGTLRVAMTASDVPTTTGAPDNGYEGVRFLGYPVFEGLVLWDLKRTDKLAEHPARPGRALGAGCERQGEVDLPPAQGREVP